MSCRCRNCRRPAERGILPARHPGLVQLVATLVAWCLLAPAGVLLFPGGYGAWWPLVLPAQAAAALLVGSSLWVAIEVGEWLHTRRRRCGSCGARAWEPPWIAA